MLTDTQFVDFWAPRLMLYVTDKFAINTYNC